MWFLESSFTTLNASTAFRTSLQPSSAMNSTHRMLHQWHAMSSAIDNFDEDYLPSHSLAELDIDDGISTWSLRELDVAATASESKASAEDNVRFIAVRAHAIVPTGALQLCHYHFHEYRNCVLARLRY